MLSFPRSFVRRPIVIGSLRYVAAAAMTVVAVIATIVAEPWIGRTLFVFSFAVVSLCAWLLGLGPALLAAVVSVLGIDYFLIPPRGSFEPTGATDLVAIAAFALVSVLIAWLSQTARGSIKRATLQSEQLQRLNASLESMNAELARNKQFLEEAQRSGKLGSWEWIMATNMVTWSDEMFRVYGWEPGQVDVSFQRFLASVHPDDRSLMQAMVQRALDTREGFSFDHRVVWPSGAVHWLHARGRVITGPDGAPTGMVGSAQDVTERRRASEGQRLLAEASEVLASSLDYESTLNAVANLAVRNIADWCSVAIGDETGRYEYIAVAHRDRERVRWVLEYSRLHPPRINASTGVPNVLRTGRSEYYPDVDASFLASAAASEEERFVLETLGTRSVIIVPMIARGRTIGAVTFIAAESAHRFDASDLWLAERLASRAAIAIDNARLYDEARKARTGAEDASPVK